jgi:hypothetical protein
VLVVHRHRLEMATRLDRPHKSRVGCHERTLRVAARSSQTKVLTISMDPQFVEHGSRIRLCASTEWTPIRAILLSRARTRCPTPAGCHRTGVPERGRGIALYRTAFELPRVVGSSRREARRQGAESRLGPSRSCRHAPQTLWRCHSHTASASAQNPSRFTRLRRDRAAGRAFRVGWPVRG